MPVDFGSQAQRSPDYLAINPKGRVPALVTESGTLTETPGLLLFVAQRFPNAELAPLLDPFALAQVQEFNSYLCSTVHVRPRLSSSSIRSGVNGTLISAIPGSFPCISQHER